MSAFSTHHRRRLAPRATCFGLIVTWLLVVPSLLHAESMVDCRDPSVAPRYPADTGQTGITPQTAAVRFLNMATFGANTREITHLGGMTTAAWLNEQFRLPASCHLATLNYSLDNNDRSNRLEVWWRHAVTAPDQLRQRVAFALSQIFVVSEVNSPISQNGLAIYYDIMVRNAFGNFRDLIQEVTLSPAMGRYLSMLGNQKPDLAAGIRADENYARELMQLFTIGLVQLNPNGTPVRVDGQTVPTYTQEDVEGLARVFTGWTWGDSLNFDDGDDWRLPMRAFENYHDRKEKVIVGGKRIPAGGTAADDLRIALNTLFNHPNVGPYFSKQLIQRLVTSNPSPAYVARVARKFDDNGQGVRGDLEAVVRAILLDDEAAGSTQVNPDFGKMREPVLVMAHLWRAFGGQAEDGQYYYQQWSDALGQVPMASPTVFNFYRPTYSPNGPLKNQGLVGPEFQLANDATLTTQQNELFSRIFNYHQLNPYSDANNILIDIRPLKNRALTPSKLVGYIDLMLTGKRLPAAFKSALIEYIKGVPMNTWEGSGIRRSTDALYLIISSPYYMIQY